MGKRWQPAGGGQLSLIFAAGRHSGPAIKLCYLTRRARSKPATDRWRRAADGQRTTAQVVTHSAAGGRKTDWRRRLQDRSPAVYAADVLCRCPVTEQDSHWTRVMPATPPAAAADGSRRRQTAESAGIRPHLPRLSRPAADLQCIVAGLDGRHRAAASAVLDWGASLHCTDGGVRRSRPRAVRCSPPRRCRL